MNVEQFFAWFSTADANARAGAPGVLLQAWANPTLNAEAREALEVAMTVLAEDDDPCVRIAFAEAIADCRFAPRYVVLMLAGDHAEIACPVVERSPVLIDAELVDLIGRGSAEIQFAVAGRARVGIGVAAALAEVGDIEAVRRLLGNPGAAQIQPFSLQRIVERFGEDREIREHLLARPDVPVELRHQILERLAAVVDNLIVLHSALPEARRIAALRDAKDKATVALAAEATAREVPALIAHLRQSGQLTTSLVLRATCAGNIRFFEEAVAQLAGVPTERVFALIAENRESSFLALYRRAGLADRAYPAFRAAVDVYRDLVIEAGQHDGAPSDQSRFARRMIERVLTHYSSFEQAEVEDLVALLRRFEVDAARRHVRALARQREGQAEMTLLPRPNAVAVFFESMAELRGDAEQFFGRGNIPARNDDESSNVIIAEHMEPTSMEEHNKAWDAIEEALLRGFAGHGTHLDVEAAVALPTDVEAILEVSLGEVVRANVERRRAALATLHQAAFAA